MRIFRKTLIVIFIIIPCILLFACDAGSEPGRGEYIDRAQRYIEKTEFQPALIELKNALQQDPDNAQARFLMGQIYIRLAEGASAEKELHKATMLGISQQETQLLMAEALLLQGKYQALLDLQLASNLPLHSQSTLHALRGSAYLGLREAEAAGKEFGKALAIDGENEAAIVGMAKLAAVQGDLDQARHELEHVFTINNNNADAWALLADIERTEGNLQAAIQAYSSAAENRVANARDLVNRSLVYITLKEYEKAESDIRQLKSRIKGTPAVTYTEGLLYFHQQRYADAQVAFEKILAANANYYPAFYYLGASHFMQGHREQATDYLNRVITRDPKQVPALKMLATLSLQSGNYSEAERLIRPVVEQYPEDTFALNLLGSASMNDNRLSESVSYFQKIIELQPGSAIAHNNLGLALLREGKISEALAEMEQAQNLQPDNENVSVKLILIHLHNKSYDEALKIALEHRENHQEDATAHYLVGAAYIGSGEAEKAVKAFESALVVEPGNIPASSALAKLAFKSKQFDKARRYYQDALDIHPENLRTLTDLALLEAAQGNEDAMVASFEQAIKFHPQVLLPRLSLARYYSKMGQADKVIEVLSPMRLAHPDNPNVRALLGESELAVSNNQQAVSDLTALVELAPTNVWAHFTLARAYVAIKDKARVQLELNKVLELDEKHVLARIMLVKILLADKNTNEAGPHIKILKQQTQGRNEVLMLEARQAELSGNAQKAIAIYQQIFDGQSNNFNLLRLEDVLWKSGQQTKATILLEQWLAEYPEDYLTLLQLARRNVAQGQEKKAIATYKRVLEISPENVIALNNLAWHLREVDPVQAVKYGEKAYALAPDSDAIMDSLALALSKTDITRSQRLILRALDRKPDNPTYLYHHAQILNIAGSTKQAVKVLESLLEQQSDFPEHEEAEKMLKALKNWGS